MKRIWILILVLLLCGCTAVQNGPTEPLDEPVLTVEPWDSEGVLTELVLTIPGGSSYTECMGFRNCLLLWSMDGHREGEQIMELCLIDPGKNIMVARRAVSMPNPVSPQIYGDSLYLCDPKTGTVIQLDLQLEITGQWTVPTASAEDAVWYAANRKLWEFAEGQPLRCLTLSDMYWTEENQAYWKQVRLSGWMVDQHRLSGGIVSFSCRNGEEKRFYALDLTEGTVITPPGGYEDYDRSGNVWLGSRYSDGYQYGICVGGGAMRKISPTDGTLTLLTEGYLLEQSPHDQYLRLYDREGRCISVCRLWENLDGYADYLIWNDALGGYLIHYQPHSGGSRLLFWDIRKGTGTGADLKLRSIPANVQDAIRAEADALGQRFGVSIMVGTDCDLELATAFGDSTASYAVDFDQVCHGLDILEKALQAYPDEFFLQLREASSMEIRFQLFADLSGAVTVQAEAVDLLFDAVTMDEATVCHVVDQLAENLSAAE